MDQFYNGPILQIYNGSILQLPLNAMDEELYNWPHGFSLQIPNLPFHLKYTGSCDNDMAFGQQLNTIALPGVRWRRINGF